MLVLGQPFKFKTLSLLLITVLMLSLFVGCFEATAKNGWASGEVVVKGPARELKVYRGVWMPALALEILSGRDVQPMSDVETLRRDGVNIVGLAVQAAVGEDGSIDVEKFHMYLQAIKKAMSNYHREGFEVFLTLEVNYGGKGEPVPVPREIVEKEGFIEQYNSLVLELAKVAEEYNVEVFAPTLEPDYYLGGVDFAAKWCQEILPKVREYYKGKLMVRLAFQEIALKQIDFNIQGYDILGICIYPFEDTKVSRERVKLFIGEALKLASKYGVSSVTTEFGVWGGALRASISEETKAEAFRVVFEEGEGKLDGFFVFDPPVSFNWSLKGSLAEQVMREWYTKKLLEPAKLEVASLSITPVKASIGEAVKIQVKILNLGEKTCEKELTLKINGRVEKVEKVTVLGGEEKTVTFKVAKSEADFYTVEVDGLHGNFTVRTAKIKQADLNNDGKIDNEDLKVLKKVYGLMLGRKGFMARADLNSDGLIDIVDLAILASQYKQNKQKPSKQKSFKWVSDVTPGRGPGIPPKGVVDGPWNHRLLLATSTNGTHWNKTYTILADQASVPDVIVDGEGNLRVYYVDYFNGGITVAISPDGENWVYRRVKGLTPEWVDPDVVVLSDGRYRLYASYMPLSGSQDKIVSAISEDGISFTPEKGYRYHKPGSLVADPDVFQFKGKWYMVVGPELTLLESEDGLTFREVRKLLFGSGVSCTIPFDKGLRIYFHRDEPEGLKIYLSHTEDLENWSTSRLVLSGEQNTVDQYGVGDPAVVKLPKGGYLMVYKTWIESPVKAGTQTQIQTATREEIPVYPGSSTYTVSANLKSAINLSEEIPVEGYSTDAPANMIVEWYKQKMADWELRLEKNESIEILTVYKLVFKKGENGALIVVVEGWEKDRIILISAGAWVEETPKEAPTQEVHLFYELPELEEGTIVFHRIPMRWEDFSFIEPLGNLNPKGGHTFPSDHGGFAFKNPDAYPPSYEVRAPADGIIVEIQYRLQDWPPESGFKGKYDDYGLLIAHTKTFMSYLDHVSKLNPKILEQAGELREGINRVKIPVKEGELLGWAGGRPKAQTGMDWGVYDKNVVHFIHPEKYWRMAYAAHFIEYCDESLKAKLMAKLKKRNVEPYWGEFDYDQPGKLVGNWFLKGINEKDPLGEWDKHLAFVYYMYDRSQIRIAIGGTLPVEVSTEGYAVVGNSPDPADVTVETGKVVYWLTTPPELGVERLPNYTLLVQMLDNETIKVEVFPGHIQNPEFTKNALIYTR